MIVILRRLLSNFLVIALVALNLRAQDSGWLIERMTIRLNIRPDGIVDATESIDVDFLSLERRGIFRDIDFRFQYEGRQLREYDIDLRAVTNAEGAPHQVKTTNEGATKRFRIGDPDRTVTSKQAYRLMYTIGGALNGFPDHDELYWNATGVWPVPLVSASVVVTGPAASLQRVECFQGPRGSTERCDSRFTAAEATFSATRTLQPGEQLTIVAGLRKGAVPDPKPMLVARGREPDEYIDTSPTMIALSGTLFLALVGAIITLWSRMGRDKQFRAMHYGSEDGGEEITAPMGARPIAVEFEPPEKIRPAQIGLIIDEKVDTLDVTATIVDLAVRGYLRITEIPKTGWFGSVDWQLNRLDIADSDLLLYERLVLSGLFESGGEVRISELEKEFYTHLPGIREKLYDDALQRRWFPRSPESVRAMWLVIGVITIVAGVGLAVLLGSMGGAGLIGVAVVAAGIVLVLFSGSMPRRTALGSSVFQRTLGFAKYMRTAEKNPQAFAERANIFTEYLPYAIVFKCVDKWANAFRNIDLQPQTTGWYSGQTAFNAAYFSSSLNTFSSSISTAMTSTPGSSGGSGFSGGGSSGGGGGGGGGGSW